MNELSKSKEYIFPYYEFAATGRLPEIQPFWVSCCLSLIILIMVLIQIAFYTLAERKLMAAIQRRRGPDVNGIFGFLQPFLDGLKLILKETIIPNKAHKFYFLFGPVFFLGISLCNWAVIPFDKDVLLAYVNNSVLVQLTFSSLSIYGIIISGWSSNSKYALLGAIRAVAQLISYELPMTLCLLTVTLVNKSFNFQIIGMVQGVTVWNIFFLFPLFIVYCICMLAETNRAPFDLPEAEAELVAGYNVEYSSIGFAMFFLGEYSNMILAGYLISFFFLGGSYFFGYYSIIWLLVKVIIILMLFIIIRATLPRYRYDQLMFLCWKVLLPLSFSFFCVVFYLLIIAKCSAW